MKRFVLLSLLLLAGCARAQDKPILELSSSDSWHLAVSTRQGPLTLGSNSFVLALQSPDRAWVRPADVTLKMAMTPKHKDGNVGPADVNLQPDGENGHYLAIVDLPKADEWLAHLSISYKSTERALDFELSNR